MYFLLLIMRWWFSVSRGELSRPGLQHLPLSWCQQTYPDQCPARSLQHHLNGIMTIWAYENITIYLFFRTRRTRLWRPTVRRYSAGTTCFSGLLLPITSSGGNWCFKHCRWNPADFGNITDTRLPYDKVEWLQCQCQGRPIVSIIIFITRYGDRILSFTTTSETK